MAWIKARNTNLFDVTSVHVQDEHSLAVRARTQGYQVPFTLGEYSTHATAETVKDEIEAWLDAGGEGLYKMPSEAELCGEKSQPEHSKRDPKTVQDVKVFPAHDARKPRTAFCCDAFRRDVQLGVFGGNDNVRDGSWWILREGSKHRMNFCPFCSALLKGSMYAATEYKE